MTTVSLAGTNSSPVTLPDLTAVQPLSLAGLPVGAAAGGLTAGGVTTQSSLTPAALGSQFNYTVVVQVPVPFLAVNLNAAALIEAALDYLKVPEAMTFMLDNVVSMFQNILNDVQRLLKAIPEATVTLQVRLGEAIVLNVQLVVVKVPVQIPAALSVPAIVLPFGSFASDLNFVIPSFSAPPVVIQVPIPYPVLELPQTPTGLVEVLPGTQISATAGVSGPVPVLPAKVISSTYLPEI